MASLLYIHDSDNVKKINIDDLYEKKKQRDLKQISNFNKILNRIHKRINITGRTKRNEKYIWYQIPEYIFGEPVYDKGDCIAYIIDKLQENGFFIKYLHPNTLFISWENWVPTYVRNEIKKKRGIVIDEHGQIVPSATPENEDNGGAIKNETAGGGSGATASNGTKKDGKIYKSISNYKPTGNLVYNPEMFETLEKKIVL